MSKMATEKRLILLDHALQAVSENYRSDMPKHELDVLIATRKRLKAMPTVDAVEVVHGRWVDRYGGKYANPLYECSECKKKAPYKFEDDSLHIGLWLQDLTDYCPNCGAKMDGGVDNGG